MTSELERTLEKMLAGLERVGARGDHEAIVASMTVASGALLIVDQLELLPADERARWRARFNEAMQEGLDAGRAGESDRDARWYLSQRLGDLLRGWFDDVRVNAPADGVMIHIVQPTEEQLERLVEALEGAR